MKNILSLLGIILILSSCNGKKIEVIGEKNYLIVDEIDNANEIKSNFSELIKDFNFFSEKHNQIKKATRFYFNYELYVNTSGEVEKIRPVNSYPDNDNFYMNINSESVLNSKDMTDYIVNFFEKNDLLIGMKKNEPKNYIITFKTAGITGLLGKEDSTHLSIGFEDGKMVSRNFSIPTKEHPNFPNPVKDNEQVYFVAVEEPPIPIGGIETIQKNVKYPEIAKRAGIEGRVFIKAFINENGDVVKAEVLKGIGSGCDEAALKAVMVTKFKPGMQRGKPVKTQVAIPIIFKLLENGDRSLDNRCNLYGKIIDKDNFEISGANLVLDGTKFGAASDFFGNFVIKGIPPAAYILKVTHASYKPKTVQLKLIAGQSKNLKIILEK
jgi:TonB family protein